MKAVNVPPRRVRVFNLPIRFIAALITGRDGEARTLKLLNDGIPEDAEIIGVHYDFNRDEIEVKVAHASFPDVPEGYSCERIAVYFERGPNDNFLELL